jgi:serine/threonine protein kinase
MSLGIGTKLGPYEILAPVGAGGMGEVYQARDTRLDLIVAVKVAKEQFSEPFERGGASYRAVESSPYLRARNCNRVSQVTEPVAEARFSFCRRITMFILGVQVRWCGTALVCR